MVTGFGDHLRGRRRAAGISQRKLAEAVGVDFSYISKVENGHLQAPATETLQRIADALGTPVDELLAAARKVPKAVGESVAGSAEAQRFLQMASEMGLSESEWEKLVGELKSMRTKDALDGGVP